MTDIPADLLAELHAALEECSDDLATLVDAQHALSRSYPSLMRRWRRDMGPVERARDVLRRLDEATR